MIAADLVERLAAIAVVLQHDRRETVDDPQRRAQVVRHRVRETVEFAGRVLQLACSLGELPVARIELSHQRVRVAVRHLRCGRFACDARVAVQLSALAVDRRAGQLECAVGQCGTYVGENQTRCHRLREVRAGRVVGSQVGQRALQQRLRVERQRTVPRLDRHDKSMGIGVPAERCGSGKRLSQRSDLALAASTRPDDHAGQRERGADRGGDQQHSEFNRTGGLRAHGPRPANERSERKPPSVP
jgi:hypothetical protein